MSGDGLALREHGRVAAREIAAVIVVGLVGAVSFLVMIQGSLNKGYTDLNFNHSLGQMIRGHAETASANNAFGVIGDTAAPDGLYATIALAIALAAAMSVAGALTGLRRRHWTIAALPLAGVCFLLLGLVYCPLVDHRLGQHLGLFGTGGGGITTVVLAGSSLGFGLIVSRCHSLMVTPEWWRPSAPLPLVELGHPSTHPVGGSLELAEDRPEEGGVRE